MPTFQLPPEDLVGFNLGIFRDLLIEYQFESLNQSTIRSVQNELDAYVEFYWSRLMVWKRIKRKEQPKFRVVQSLENPSSIEILAVNEYARKCLKIIQLSSVYFP